MLTTRQEISSRSWRLPYNPENAIGEILGRRAIKGQKPSPDFICPFLDSRCVKRSTQRRGEAYPICSLWRGAPADPTTRRQDAKANLIAVCPKRFYAIDFFRDVVTHCWPGPPPDQTVITREIKMEGFGNVDFVIAEVKDEKIGQFLSVELQTVDITGSAFPAYEAICDGYDMPVRSGHGFNWKNVYKRYITQLIHKGFLHQHWRSKIIAVIPDQVYDEIWKHGKFVVAQDVRDIQTSIVFMTYRLEADPTRLGEFIPVLQRVVGTSHSALQSAILYNELLPRETFTTRVLGSIDRTIDLSGITTP